MKASFVSVALALSALAGCIEPTGMVGTTPQVTESQRGTITGVREVATGGGQTDQIAGAVIGGLVGGLMGNQFGGGSGNGAATAIGAIGGAAAGSQLAANANQDLVREWSVQLDDGRAITIVQNDSFAIDQRVTVIREGKGYRIIR